MKLFIDGVEFYPGEMTIRESCFEYSAVLSFTSFMPLVFQTASVQFDGLEDKVDYTLVTMEQVADTSFQYLCYPKGYIDFINMTIKPQNMQGTLKDLLDTLAVCEVELYSETQKQHWVLPSMRGKALIDFLTDRVIAVKGGCPTFHFGTSGRLTFVDLLASCVTEPMGVFTGTLKSSKSSDASMNAIPGKVNYTFFTEDTYSSRVAVYMQNTGISNYFKYIATEDIQDQVIASMQAKFWRNFIRNSLATYTHLVYPVIIPGFLCRRTDGESYTDAVCVSKVTTVNHSDPVITGEFYHARTAEQSYDYKG